MNFKNNFSNGIRNLIKCFPILVILTVWLVFSSQYLLKGAAPFPSSYLLNNFDPWNEYDLLKGPVKNGATPDVITQIFPWKRIVIDSYKSGNFPLWNTYSFSGTPLLANYQSAVLSPLNLLYFILPFVDAWSISILLQPLLACLFMFIYLRSINRSDYGSILGAIAFGFCGFITTWMMYGTLGFAILYLPLALFSIEKFYQTKKWHYSLLLSLTIPLSFFSGHFQTSLYFLIFVSFYILFKYLTERNKKMFVFTIISILLGLLMSAPQILPSIEFYFNSARDSTYFISEIIPWSYIATFFAPDFFGNSVTRNDWFGHYAEWNAYLGLIPLALGLFAIKKRNSYTNFFAISSLIILFFAFKSPVQDLIINLHVPVLSTSAAGRIIVLFSFSFAVLSSFGLDLLIKDIRSKKLKPIFIWLCLIMAIFISLWSLIIFKFYIPSDKIGIAFSNMRLPSVIFAAFVFVLILGIAVKIKKFALLLPFAIIALVSFDMLRFSLKWMPFEDKKLVFPKVKLAESVRWVAPHDRMIATFGNEGSGILKIASTEGYDPLYIESYGEFVAGSIYGKYRLPERSVVKFPRVSKNSYKLLNFLGVRYIIHKIGDGHNGWTYPFWDYPIEDFKLIENDGKYQVFDNLKVFPRAFLVGKYRVSQDKEKIIKEIYSDDFDLRHEVILGENPKINIEKGNDDQASIIKYSPNFVRIETNSAKNSLLVLTDPFYPGWRAYVDNKKARILRADHASRAVEVPSGNHIVSFIYSPQSVKVGFILLIFGISGIFGLKLLLENKKI